MALITSSAVPVMCLISFWYWAFKHEESDEAMQPAAALGWRTLLVCIGHVCFLHVLFSVVQKWWLLLPLFCHWGDLNAEKWLGSSYTPDWWWIKSRAHLLGLCYLRQTLLIFKASQCCAECLLWAHLRGAEFHWWATWSLYLHTGRVNCSDFAYSL